MALVVEDQFLHFSSMDLVLVLIDLAEKNIKNIKKVNIGT